MNAVGLPWRPASYILLEELVNTLTLCVLRGLVLWYVLMGE